jgi:coniferyl-aldehyde dehydrogenase
MDTMEHLEQHEDEQVALHAPFHRLHTMARTAPFPSWEIRQGWLQTLERLIDENSTVLIQAVSEDFGHRSIEETQIAELFPLREGIRYAKHKLRGWMRPQRRHVSRWFWPAQNHVFPQPLGVVGIVVPWNYPIYLALGPLTAALAAGNRVMIKMSESTPRTGDVLQRLAQQYFGSELVVVVNGDLTVAQAFTRLPFDHLFFTGSASVGRQVILAAAEHLTPLTLELGGKSPAIVTGRAHLKRTAQALVVGKMLNAGQTCSIQPK